MTLRGRKPGQGAGLRLPSAELTDYFGLRVPQSGQTSGIGFVTLASLEW